MQSVIERDKPHQSQTIAYSLKAIVVCFGAGFVLSYVGYLYVQITSGDGTFDSAFVSPITVFIPFVLGWLIDKKQPGHTIALLFLVMAYSTASTGIAGGLNWLNEAYPGRFAEEIDSATLTVGHLMWAPAVFFPLYLIPLYFPSGELLSPRWRIPVIIVLGNLAWLAMGISLRPWPWPENDIPDTRAYNGIAGSEQFFEAGNHLLTPFMILITLLVPIAMFLRYRRAQGIERVQMKWPLAAIAIFLLTLPVYFAFPGLSGLDAEWGYPLTWTLAMLFPLSIGIAILRHNLFDIDVIINRTLVYGILTGLVIVFYVAIVGVLGSLVQQRISVLSGLVATAIVAVIFQPLREQLQHIVNRVMYGERDDPSVVLSRLAYQLETADTPAAILPNLVQTIANTLKIPYVAIWLPTLQDQMEVVAEWGKPPEQREMIALVYQNKTIGHLVVSPRGVNEHFRAGERKLLTTIATLTATTVRAVQLSEELRQSRQRIVTAREEERRRIRRDLHDGLGPQLASQTLGLEAIAQLMPVNPQKAHSLLKSLKAQAHEAIQDVRHLVYDLRPPALDDLGLIGALKQNASRYATSNLRFSFYLPDVPNDLPAAVETAIYRIAQEAMTNVVRHAEATHCIVRIYCTDDAMFLEIEDDGCGLPESYQVGIGLQTMRERAAELNGQASIGVTPGGGTRVEARLPLEVSHA